MQRVDGSTSLIAVVSSAQSTGHLFSADSSVILVYIVSDILRLRIGSMTAPRFLVGLLVLNMSLLTPTPLGAQTVSADVYIKVDEPTQKFMEKFVPQQWQAAVYNAVKDTLPLLQASDSLYNASWSNHGSS
jgi:hypothetical protein